MEAGAQADDTAARARDWHHARHEAVCDVIEPWAHGTVVRATRYPEYWDFNLVRVEEDPGMSADELIAFADEALAGLAHGRVDFGLADVGDSLRPGFEARGWNATRLVFMHHEGPVPDSTEISVEEVPYEEVDGLRLAWHQEDFPGQPNDHHAHAREVALARNARIFVVREDDAPVAFAQIERVGGSAEITQVYVHPDERGGGLGTALTSAAIAAAGPVDDLWIAADDEDRPKQLYARLGFRPAWVSVEITRLPAVKG